MSGNEKPVVVQIGMPRNCARKTLTKQELEDCNRREKMFNACKDLLQGFQINWVEIDHEAGFLYSNHSRSMYQMLEQNRIDGYNGLFHLSEERHQLYQFAQPVAYNTVNVYARKLPFQSQQHLPEQMLNFVRKPFSGQIWFVVPLVAIIFVAVNFLRRYNSRTPTAYARAHAAVNPSHSYVSKRFLRSSLAFLCACYSAELTANTVTLDSCEVPRTIESLTAMIAQGRVTLLTQNPMSSTFELINRSNAEPLKALRRALVSHPLRIVPSVTAACELVANSSVSDIRRYIFVEGSLTFLENPACRRLMCGMIGIPLEGLGSTAWTSAVFRKNAPRNSTLLRVFNECATSGLAEKNYHRLLLESHDNAHYCQQEMEQQSSCSEIGIIRRHRKALLIGLHQIKDAMELLILLHVFSFLVLLMEKLSVRFLRRRCGIGTGFETGTCFGIGPGSGAEYRTNYSNQQLTHKLYRALLFAWK